MFAESGWKASIEQDLRQSNTAQLVTLKQGLNYTDSFMVILNGAHSDI